MKKTTRKSTRTVGGIPLPSSVMKTPTAVKLDKIIAKNTKVFKLGTTVPTARLRGWFKIPQIDITNLTTTQTVTMVKNHTMCMLTAYTKFNKLLAKRGLVIRQEGKSYRIQTLPNTARRVASIKRVSATKALRAKALGRGVKRYQGMYSQLSTAELADL